MENINNLNNISGANILGQNPEYLLGAFASLIIILIIWSLIWKGFALWKAAKNHSKAWFIVLLIINTMGILEILYIFLFSKMGKKNSHKSVENKN